MDQIETVGARPGREMTASVPYNADGSEYKAAFGNYLRKGDAGLESLQLKALLVGSNADGGYLVTPPLVHRCAFLQC